MNEAAVRFGSGRRTAGRAMTLGAGGRRERPARSSTTQPDVSVAGTTRRSRSRRPSSGRRRRGAERGRSASVAPEELACPAGLQTELGAELRLPAGLHVPGLRCSGVLTGGLQAGVLQGDGANEFTYLPADEAQAKAEAAMEIRPEERASAVAMVMSLVKAFEKKAGGKKFADAYPMSAAKMGFWKKNGGGFATSSCGDRLLRPARDGGERGVARGAGGRFPSVGYPPPADGMPPTGYARGGRLPPAERPARDVATSIR